MHKYKLGVLIAVLAAAIIILVLVFSSNSPPIDMSNPASVFCIDQGGDLKMYSDDSGIYGMCSLPGGDIVCEQWAFFRGECPLTAQTKYMRHDCRLDEKQVDVCHEVYQVVCGFSGKGSREYSNGCFACKDADVIFWVTGNCEDK